MLWKTTRCLLGIKFGTINVVTPQGVIIPKVIDPSQYEDTLEVVSLYERRVSLEAHVLASRDAIDPTYDSLDTCIAQEGRELIRLLEMVVTAK